MQSIRCDSFRTFIGIFGSKSILNMVANKLERIVMLKIGWPIQNERKKYTQFARFVNYSS